MIQIIGIWKATKFNQIHFEVLRADIGDVFGHFIFLIWFIFSSNNVFYLLLSVRSSDKSCRIYNLSK